MAFISPCLYMLAGTLQGLFSQILQDDIVDVARERAIQFMATKMKTLPEDTWTKDIEEYLIVECRKVGELPTQNPQLNDMHVIK